MPFGLNLLLELTFIFLVSVKADVVPDDLKLLVIGEFSNILNSIVQSDRLYCELVKERDGKLLPIL